jgi:hypothetical protein
MLTVRAVIVEAVTLIIVCEVLKEIVSDDIISESASTVSIDSAVVRCTVHEIIKDIVLDYYIN